MSDTIPLFPLGTVLFPGVVIPLHIFEERYRTLVRDLQQRSVSEFGIVTIRQGWEVGADGVDALAMVGTTAALRSVRPLPDGRFDIVCVGVRRFRLQALEPAPEPYLMGQVDWFPDSAGDPAAVEPVAARVRAELRAYARDLGRKDGSTPSEAEADQGAELSLPDDPAILSNLVAASAPFDLHEKQELLEVPTVHGRLAAEVRLLRRERAVLRAISAVPAPVGHLGTVPSPN